VDYTYVDTQKRIEAKLKKLKTQREEVE